MNLCSGIDFVQKNYDQYQVLPQTKSTHNT